MNEDVVQDAIRSSIADDGQLTCVAAHRIAERLEVEPEVVGEQANGIDIRITKCHLGLFGYAPQKGMPGYKRVKTLDALPEPVSGLVKNAAVQGRITCRELWHIGQEQGVNRLEMGNIAETLKLKVTPCQLGCF